MILSWDLLLWFSSNSSSGEKEGDGLTLLDLGCELSRRNTASLGLGLTRDISLNTILTFASVSVSFLFSLV